MNIQKTKRNKMKTNTRTWNKSLLTLRVIIWISRIESWSDLGDEDETDGEGGGEEGEEGGKKVGSINLFPYHHGCRDTYQAKHQDVVDTDAWWKIRFEVGKFAGRRGWDLFIVYRNRRWRDGKVACHGGWKISEDDNIFWQF